MDTERERILRAEQQALISELERLEAQRAAHMRRLKEIRFEVMQIGRQKETDVVSE